MKLRLTTDDDPPKWAEVDLTDDDLQLTFESFVRQLAEPLTYIVFDQIRESRLNG